MHINSITGQPASPESQAMIDGYQACRILGDPLNCEHLPVAKWCGNCARNRVLCDRMMAAARQRRGGK